MRSKTLAFISLALLAAEGPASAGSLTVRITDRDGAPVPEVGVWLEPAARRDGTAHERANGAAGQPHADGPNVVTMNQRALQFDPHVLIVEIGSAVEFPNEDDVRHHVYSFSDQHRFAMTIDSQSTHSELLHFDAPGVVTLGCNIHDDMRGYIVVVDSPLFGMTDTDGKAAFDTVAGEYELSIWTPRLPPGRLPPSRPIRLGATEPLVIEYRLEAKLYPPHQHSETSLHWERY